MLDRRPTSDPGVVEVTFRLPVEVDAEAVHVVGDFNGWSRVATPLERDEDGFSVTLPLRTGATYQFRYLLDDHVWENDWAADDYVGNEFGGENSLLDLTHGLESGGGATASHAGEVHHVGAVDEPAAAALEEALAVDALATEAQTVSEAAAILTPVAEGGLAAPPTSDAGASGANGTSQKDATAAKAPKAPKAPKRSTPSKGESSAKASKGAAKPAKGSTKGSKGSAKKSSKGTAGKSDTALTKAELLDAAKELDISGRSKMNKAELEKAVARARKA